MPNQRLQLVMAGLLFVLVAGFTGISASTEAPEGPTPFAFTNLCGQYPGVTVESDSITVTGIEDPVPIRVINGEYSINGGMFTDESGTVAFGQRVAVRHKTASGDEQTVSTVLVVGGVSGAFTSSTGPCLRGTL